mmetsp:Transcript_30686/g.35124  ORF Transcript_30686/g.35124 Transcript_30686/m.35124 type:complete len:89 (+) Transcript_30686:19-285(+)
MLRSRPQVNLEKTLSYTTSSFYYKDPFNPKANILYKLYNSVVTFFQVRNIENEFVDFKVNELKDQIPEIYKDVARAYKRKDKVIMQRS